MYVTTITAIADELYTILNKYGIFKILIHTLHVQHNNVMFIRTIVYILEQ